MKMVHELMVETEGKDTIKIIVTQKQGIRKKRKVKSWSSQEDQLLGALYQQYPKKWNTISNLMQNRNENQCLHRFRRLSNGDQHQKIWLEQQDEMVKRLIRKFGKNWKILSETMGTKTGKQIRQRFINKLDPKIKKEDWSQEQDLQLISLYTSLGSHWSQIAKKLPGRPQNKIKNRFYSYIRRTYNIKQVSSIKNQNSIKPTQIVFKFPDKQNMLSNCELVTQKQTLTIPQQSKILIQSSSYFLNENIHKTSGKQIGLSITSFTYFPEEQELIYLNDEIGL